MHPLAFDLVIFDCDGVLVDSERLSAEVLTGLMTDVGIAMTPQTFREDFLGRSFAAAVLRCENRTGKKLPADFQLQYRGRLLACMRAALKPMPGIEVLLEALAVPYCLATSSSPQRLSTALEVTGLGHYFEGKRFTASEVANGKPAPDLFLHAARQMNCEPARCLVIEDSEMGIRAANNAGMTVWHFVGGAHMEGGFAMPTEVVVDAVAASMADVGARMSKLGLCRA